MGPFGFAEIAFLFIAALVIFGPRKLPELGKTLGKGLREFKRATEDLKSNWEEQLREVERPLNDVKHSIQSAKSEVETAASLDLEQPAVRPDEEETKPDARPN